MIALPSELAAVAAAFCPDAVGRVALAIASRAPDREERFSVLAGWKVLRWALAPCRSRAKRDWFRNAVLVAVAEVLCNGGAVVVPAQTSFYRALVHLVAAAAGIDSRRVPEAAQMVLCGDCGSIVRVPDPTPCCGDVWCCGECPRCGRSTETGFRDGWVTRFVAVEVGAAGSLPLTHANAKKRRALLSRRRFSPLPLPSQCARAWPRPARNLASAQRGRGGSRRPASCSSACRRTRSPSRCASCRAATESRSAPHAGPPGPLARPAACACT